MKRSTQVIGGEFTWGCFLQEINDNHTRLLPRTRGTVRPWWYRIFINTTIPIANIFLACKMLSGIDQSAEKSLLKKASPDS